jgi:pSer/pThr/pTyr-binding forkhead associated (FHA) protein
MDVVLKVVEGAKSGGKIAVKKAEFVIGRGQDCHLCAGSSAISRKHCVILRQDARVAVKDLGSRNGTLLNGKKIEGETELKSGDEIVVGPLKFQVLITPGLANAKLPEVKSVAEAVTRAAEKPVHDPGDEDISRWLLAPINPTAGAETQTIRMDETSAASLKSFAAAVDSDTKALDMVKEEAADAEEEKKGKGPGKLPKQPSKPETKDSREAAAEALRAWSRRR